MEPSNTALERAAGGLVIYTTAKGASGNVTTRSRKSCHSTRILNSSVSGSFLVSLANCHKRAYVAEDQVSLEKYQSQWRLDNNRPCEGGLPVGLLREPQCTPLREGVRKANTEKAGRPATRKAGLSTCLSLPGSKLFGAPLSGVLRYI